MAKIIRKGTSIKALINGRWRKVIVKSVTSQTNVSASLVKGTSLTLAKTAGPTTTKSKKWS